jgi:protein-S-isoprenylcysteine O-methyltransferase Ste14
MADPIARLLTAALFMAFIAHRAYYSRRIRHRPDQVRQQPDLGARSRVAGWLSGLALLVTAIGLVVPQSLRWADVPALQPWRLLGLALAVAGFALLQWSQQALSVNWSDAPRLVAGQVLTVSGPYRWIRHPIYAAFLLILSAPLLLSGNLALGLPWILATALDVSARIEVEERLLQAEFGEAYREYGQRTGRIIPHTINPY